MAESIFDNILKKSGGKERSIQWFRNQVKEFGTPTVRKLVSDGRVRARPNFGLMNFFVYSPKHEEKLPYYDRFPLVLPIEAYNNGFLGLNFHYLSIPLRVRLLNVISEYSNNTLMNEDTRIRLTWNRIKRNPLVHPTVKRYLIDHVQTPFRVINAEEMMVAVLLPVQKFVKATENKVYSDSRKRINRGFY